MASNAPIGIFDSGMGGLSVLREIRAVLPHESLVYVADSAYVPYGEKSPELIRARCFAITDFLMSQHIKALVLACNTATAAAISELRARYPLLPVIGMEPAVKPAVKVTQTKVVGVLATTGTLKSAKFAALLDRFAHDIRVITQPCPGLVECIESGDLASPKLRSMLKAWVDPLLAEGCDTLILGCTHYPFIKPLLAQLLPASVTVIDTGHAVARRLAEQLEAHQLLAEHAVATLQLWSSAKAPELSALLPVLLDTSLQVQTLDARYG